jgi:hypothetical protein
MTLILWAKTNPGKPGLYSLGPILEDIFVSNRSLGLGWSFEQPNQHVSIRKLVGWAIMILGMLL